MAKKISQMTEATTIKSGDISVVVQDGETKQFPLDLLATKAQADEYKTGVETKLADYEQEITDIKNQYDKELYTPTITVTNTSMVKTGQGDTLDYSASVEDGVVKSAILKGQTLVNLSTVSTLTSSVNNISVYDLKDKGKYLFKCDVSNPNNCQLNINFNFTDGTSGYDDVFVEPTFTKGSILKIFNFDFVDKIIKNFNLYIANDKDIKLTNIQLIEYQDGMENWDIPYFEGMQSVKMPVLTTTGKNLLCGENFVFNNSKDRIYRKVYLKPNTDYYMSAETGNFFGYRVMLCKNDGSVNKTPTELKQLSRKFNSENYSGEFFILFHATGLYENHGNKWAQVEEGTVATSYEPFKSNILSTPSDVVLGGIGDVKDTMDLTTGNIVERTNEITLNISSIARNLCSSNIGTKYRWRISEVPDGLNGLSDKVITCICDKFTSVSPYSTYIGIEGITKNHSTNDVFLYIEKYSDGTDTSRDALLNELKALTIKFRYLKKPTNKTVVLNTSGTLASETPYMWKDGSIQLSSDGLVPGLDYAVTTSRVGVIENNVAETIINEKRIHALEVILAQSTIAAAADAVSLQSDLESTTMSTDGANLETENTQDDFLYEMILLLIENNAYDESLFDKVCMFYLYGKLSDEQFTNIYNLLYPVNP